MAMFFGNTEPALHQASKSGQVQAVWLLLQRGADVNSRDSFSRTALHWAAEYGFEAVVRLLLENNVDIEARGGVGWTALHCAAAAGHVAVARLLLEKGANIEARDYKGQSPLHVVAWNGQEAVLRLFLQKGVNVDVKDTSGYMALNYATGKGYGAIVQLLAPLMQNSNYNPLAQSAQFNRLMSQPQGIMQMPGYGNAALQQNYMPGLRQNTPALGFGPSAPLQNQLNMQQFIAYAGDYQLSYPTQNTAAPGNPWINYAGS